MIGLLPEAAEPGADRLRIDPLENPKVNGREWPDPALLGKEPNSL